ncbi:MULTISPECIES: condensation domain-containing protein [unclassified Rhizobium]|uniref:hypothetical protein n=1 Tax=unclassified Rhizobium TaxID=2613769 RepID=UPI001ADAE51E|nr:MULTISPECIES: hypothetical protein [unclassified Rhizobium]MBO9127981.1 hypothetical protein [Rhizobium sp. 16-488-2b]MBO9178558.1 hypothetical protein [Rhizobium sp. 16-488-2a]
MPITTPPMLRTLGALEHLFAAYGEDGTMNFTIAARISGALSESAITAALAKVQERHVLLRASLGWGEDGAHCFMLSERPIPLSVIAAPATSWDRIAESEMNMPLLSADIPLVRATMASESGSTILFLTFNHAVADGMAAVLVMREVLTVLGGAKLSIAAEDRRLEDKIGLEVPRFFRSSSDSVGIVDTAAPISSSTGRATVDAVEFDKDRFTRLQQTAKSRAMTINTMITAALGRALVSLNDRWSEGALRVMSPIDLRSGFDIPDHVGLSLSIAITPFERSATAFWDEASRVQEQIARFRDKKMALRMVDDIAKRCFADASYEATRHRVLEHGPFDSVMTNFGVLQVPTSLGDLVVEKMWAPALRSMPGQDVVAAATFDGALSLVHTSVAGTEGLLARIVQILEEA